MQHVLNRSKLILISALLAVGLLVACGPADDPATAPGTTAPTTAPADPAADPAATPIDPDAPDTTEPAAPAGN